MPGWMMADMSAASSGLTSLSCGGRGAREGSAQGAQRRAGVSTEPRQGGWGGGRRVAQARSPAGGTRGSPAGEVTSPHPTWSTSTEKEMATADSESPAPATYTRQAWESPGAGHSSFLRAAAGWGGRALSMQAQRSCGAQGTCLPLAQPLPIRSTDPTSGRARMPGPRASQPAARPPQPSPKLPAHPPPRSPAGQLDKLVDLQAVGLGVDALQVEAQQAWRGCGWAG